jgi:hypothetical protein
VPIYLLTELSWDSPTELSKKAAIPLF